MKPEQPLATRHLKLIRCWLGFHFWGPKFWVHYNAAESKGIYRQDCKVCKVFKVEQAS